MIFEILFSILLLIVGAAISGLIVKDIPWFTKNNIRFISTVILGAFLFLFTIGYVIMIRDFIVPTQTEIVAIIKAPFDKRVPEEYLPILGTVFQSIEKKYNISDELDYREVFVYTRKEMLLKYGVWSTWGFGFSISRDYDKGLVVISNKEKYDRYFKELKSVDKNAFEKARQEIKKKKDIEKRVQENIEKLKNLE